MTTYVSYSYQRSRATPIAKIEVRADGRLIIDGVDHDFRGAADGTITTAPPIAHALIHRDVFRFEIILPFSGEKPADLPSESFDAFPAYSAVWPAGETESPQTIASAAAHNPDAISNSDLIDAWKARINLCAISFDEGFKPHWTEHTGNAAARLSNTLDWGRSWAGYAYVRAHDFSTGGGEGGGDTRQSLDLLVVRCETELLGRNRIRTWYSTHNSAAWTSYLSNRQIFTTASTGNGGILVATAADSDTWSNWTTTQYYNALTS